MPVPTGASRTTVANLLIKRYTPEVVINQMNHQTRLLGVLNRRGRKVGQGAVVKIAIKTGKSGAGGVRDEWDDSPAADNVKTGFYDFNFKTYHRPIRLSGEIMEDSVGEGGIASALQLEVEDVAQTTRIDAERTLFLDGSGKYADVVSASSATSLVIDDMTYVQEQDRLDIVVSATGATGSGAINARVTSIALNSPSAGKATLTLASPGLIAFGSVGTSYAIYKNGTYNKDSWGLDALINNVDPGVGAFGNVERSSNSFAKAQMLDAQNGSINSSLLQALWNKQDRAAGIEKPTFCITTPEIMIDLLKRASVLKQADHREMTIDNWLTAVAVGGVPIWGHRFCQPGRLYSIYAPDIEIMYSKGVGEGRWVLDGADGGQRMQKVPGKWGYEGLFIRRSQLAARRINSQGRLFNINWNELGTV